MLEALFSQKSRRKEIFTIRIWCFCFIAEGARRALSLAGTMLGFYPVRVLPSKTAIIPVNPTFLPQVHFELLNILWNIQQILSCMHSIYMLLLQSEDEREMCARTIYCTNIDKKVDVCVPATVFWTKFYQEFSWLWIFG
jgi:hypothetical protein